jgi:hypothetical protein
MKTVYTVLAYKEDNVDTCRGCVMDRWGSDFQYGVFDTIEEAAQFQFDVGKRAQYEKYEREHEFTILVNGRECDDDDEERVVDHALTAIWNHYQHLCNMEHARVRKEQDEALILAEKEKRRKEIEAQNEKESRDREEYERLKKKFEEGPLQSS